MILFVPISILAKQICIAPSGCKIEMDTGFCPKCIEVKEGHQSSKKILRLLPFIQESMNHWKTKLKQKRKREFAM